MPTNPHRWSVADSAELYNVAAWGGGYFTVNDQGNVAVTPQGGGGPQVDVPELIENLRKRGLDTPILIRFSDILASRIRDLNDSFRRAIDDHEYKSEYNVIYPIKVNQQRHVVEELLHFGREYHLGLEAGSKPELLVALALLEDPQALIVCNGYKDEEYIETAILAQKLGRTPIIVIDRMNELDLILRVSSKLGVRPNIGVRAKLAARGAGKWMESTGDRSKFGLTSSELMVAVARLRRDDMLDCFRMLHFHIGSQITSIRAIKDAVRESSRIFVELHKLGAGLDLFDVGGGLAVDYDGSSTNYQSSANYALQEYANDVVAAITDACDDKGVPHPRILSESGRALAAHHSMLVFDVLDVDCILEPGDSATIAGPKDEEEPAVLENLREVYATTSIKNVQEAYHDALQMREEATSLFSLGYLDLSHRARVEEVFRACLARISKIVAGLDYVPPEFEHLEQRLCDTYFCNFSVFQSAPDHWAVRQLFPTMPVHRLDEEPTRRGTLADLTCDSDGKVDQFIHLREVKRVLELHDLKADEPYYLGMFLIGAYQEILGDLHNLFGDTNAVHVVLDEHGYKIEHVLEGDSVTDVLGYVQYESAALINMLRASAEQATRENRITPEESAKLLRAYRNGLAGYTYLEKGETGMW